MQTEQLIDVFTVVRLLRAIRPQLIEQVFSSQTQKTQTQKRDFLLQGQYEKLFPLLRDYAQSYLPTISSQRSREMISSGQDPLPNSNRIIQRL